MKFALIPKAAEATGYSQKAIRRKIEDGVWVEGREYQRAPDGRVHINMDAVEQWIQGSSESGHR